MIIKQSHQIHGFLLLFFLWSSFTFSGVTSFPSGSMTVIDFSSFVNEDRTFFKYSLRNAWCSSFSFLLIPPFFSLLANSFFPFNFSLEFLLIRLLYTYIFS